jgi:acyl dehydratase
LRWLEPVRPGDSLRLNVRVIESTRSASGRTGIVRWQWGLTNQRDVAVLEMTATSLFDLIADAGRP